MLTMAIQDEEILSVCSFTPDGINIYGSRGGEFEGIGSV